MLKKYWFYSLEYINKRTVNVPIILTLTKISILEGMTLHWGLLPLPPKQRQLQNKGLREIVGVVVDFVVMVGFLELVVDFREVMQN